MSEMPLAPPSTAPQAGISSLLVILGILFIAGWLSLAVTLGGLTFMASIMANDAARASTDAHMLLLVGIFSGQFLTAAAGIFGGCAIFWRGKRKLLWIWFAVLLFIGALIQVASGYYFLNIPGLAQ